MIYLNQKNLPNELLCAMSAERGANGYGGAPSRNTPESTGAERGANGTGGTPAAALGMFDGLHLGHRAVIESAVGSGYYPVLVTFRRHPRADRSPSLLTRSLRERELCALGIKAILELDFEEIKNTSPEDFFIFLKNNLHLGFAACGYNYHFGHGGAGNAETLRALCAKHKTGCGISLPVTLGGEEISSSAIRAAILNGDPEKANAMLGRAFAFDFPVLRGDARGRTLGFPTINQSFGEGFIIPKYGVYAGETVIFGKKYKSVTNVGIRPTYRIQKPLSETFIIGYDGDLYGISVEVRLNKYIRPECKFESRDALISQINRDIAFSKNF